MLKLQKHITLNKSAIDSPNLAPLFDRQDQQAIASVVHDGYASDDWSRSKWMRRMQAASDLATQLQKDKNFPWPSCSNIAFPLITIAAMQFHARAYPTIISGTDIVKMRVCVPDANGQLTARADRVSRHMSWQVLEQDTAWEEGHDRLLLCLPILGCMFEKTYFDADLRHNVSELVMPQDLVMNYWAKSTECCPRKTHVLFLQRNDVREGVLREIYTDILEEQWFQNPPRPKETPDEDRANNRKGMAPATDGVADDATPFRILEQHVSLDLDGDGYAEPYIITIEESSQSLLRIVSRIGHDADVVRLQSGKYKGKILNIQAEEYFTKYSFIPSPDGGNYDLGFGVLLGPLNESVNSIVNQLVDGGTLANTAGGFITRGAKIRGGIYTFKPFEWARVDSTGDDLRKSIFPLPVREPSAVLFNLLSLLINYTNRISGSTDTMVGENPGQNTPAQTTQSMIEMGMKIYNAIFKRVWRCMKGEFQKLYVLNGHHLDDVGTYGVTGAEITAEDYKGDSSQIVPAADPNVTSETMKLQAALMLKQTAMTTPGYNQEEVERRYLRASHVDGIELIYPGPGKPGATPPPQDPKVMLKQMDLQDSAAERQWQQQKIAIEMMEETRVNNAKISDLEADAAGKLAKAQGMGTEQEIQLANAAVGAMKARNEHLWTQITDILEHKRESDRINIDRAAATVENRPSNAKAA